MLKQMICCKILLAGVTIMLTCLAHSAEPLKIGMVAPVTGAQAEPAVTRFRVPSSLLRR